MKLRVGHRRLILISSSIGLILVFGGIIWYLITLKKPLSVEQTPSSAPSAPVESPKTADSSLSFAAMGDMLAHDSVVNQAKTANGYDFTPYFSSIRPLYDGADVVFCNPKTPSAGPAYGISGYPTFNAPQEFARDLRKSGCNLINLATNHMADKGQSAINETIAVWQAQNPLAIAGANRSQEEQQTVRYFEKNGLTVAFVAFADFSNVTVPAAYSVNLYRDEALVTQLIKTARQSADVVIVSAHWGTEDSHGVNANQRRTAQQFADLGADVIIGTGPHVIQPVTWVTGSGGRKTLVWYSIGNMLSSQLAVDQLTGGVARFTITKKNHGIEITSINLAGTFMSYEWSAADKAAMNLAGRHTLRLQPLRATTAETGLFGVNPAERSVALRQWLGSDVEMTITP